MNKIAILGGGESGTGAAVLAKTKGFEVFLSDNGKIPDNQKARLAEWKIDYEEGGHSVEKILEADEIIKSPGIPDTAGIIRKVKEAGINIISEIEFAGRYDRAKKICITGSNGKTTTTSLIYHLLQLAGLNVGLGGNIGKSYAYQVATCDFDIYVLEISSFQLDNMYDFKADIAILTNITPDHLDRYDHKIENYARAKFRITRNMNEDDCFIFCSDDEITIKHLNDIVIKAKMLPFTQKGQVGQGAYVENDKFIVKYGSEECRIFLDELALQGKHNLYNSMAAAIAGKAMEIDDEKIREGLKTFKNIEHRLEKVATVGGLLYKNDSKATNVNSAWYALESMDRPVVWIAGGTDKGNDYSELYDLARQKVKALICLGKDNRKLHESFSGIIPVIEDASSAEEAVSKAYGIAASGDTVLLSPCCASFDLFKNYEERGRLFKEAVRNL